MDPKFKKELIEIIDDRLDKKLDEKLDQKLDEKLPIYFNQFFDKKIWPAMKNMAQEINRNTNRAVAGLSIRVDNHEKRISKLEDTVFTD